MDDRPVRALYNPDVEGGVEYLPFDDDEYAEWQQRQTELANPTPLKPTPRESVLAELEGLPPDQPVTAAQLAAALKTLKTIE